MTDRALYLVAYDIAEPRRLRRALIAVRAYASGGQKSVHECYLSPAECLELLKKLRRILNPAGDSLAVIRLDPRARPRCLGIARPPSDARVLYIG
ncbi:MAG: CRISPR-associated endonuclease Cas2 [Acidobacteriia bacterium]|nr:CRISPR-associated endonuclease Cas2 [Methyloceanibacter sp.]MCL6491361.1 CRISPR-associated endonuclease Cas2 [Terriglobia bacterium]